MPEFGFGADVAETGKNYLQMSGVDIAERLDQNEADFLSYTLDQATEGGNVFIRNAGLLSNTHVDTYEGEATIHREPYLVTFDRKTTVEDKAPRFIVARRTDNPEQAVEDFRERLDLGDRQDSNSYWLETESGLRTGSVGIGHSHKTADVYVEAVGLSNEYPAQVDEALKWI